VTLRAFRKITMVLNSAKVATDLLDSRSAIYSDRPESWMLGHLAGRNLTMFRLSSNNARFPLYRKMLHSGLNRRATQTYRPTQEQQLKVLLNGLFDNPERFVDLVYTCGTFFHEIQIFSLTAALM
jgi:hypothetical protein